LQKDKDYHGKSSFMARRILVAAYATVSEKTCGREGYLLTRNGGTCPGTEHRTAISL
jgi:hypothetical protein